MIYHRHQDGNHQVIYPANGILRGTDLQGQDGQDPEIDQVEEDHGTDIKVTLEKFLPDKKTLGKTCYAQKLIKMGLF